MYKKWNNNFYCFSVSCIQHFKRTFFKKYAVFISPSSMLACGWQCAWVLRLRKCYRVWNQVSLCAGISASDALRILPFSLGIQSKTQWEHYYDICISGAFLHVEQETRVTGISSVPNVLAILGKQWAKIPPNDHSIILY